MSFEFSDRLTDLDEVISGKEPTVAKVAKGVFSVGVKNLGSVVSGVPDNDGC